MKKKSLENLLALIACLSFVGIFVCLLLLIWGFIIGMMFVKLAATCIIVFMISGLFLQAATQ